MSEEQSLEAVVDGTLFGVVDLDIISTPDHWPEGSDYISEPHEHFKKNGPDLLYNWYPVLSNREWHAGLREKKRKPQ